MLSDNIAVTTNDTDFVVNCTCMHRYENVTSYRYELCHPTLYICYSKNNPDEGSPTENPTKYYYVIDCPGETAISHWTYESFMFYSLYSELKKQYPTLQILTCNRKKYVKLLLRFFELDDNVAYEIDHNSPNVCFFPPIISHNHLTDEALFVKYLNIYTNSIKNRLIDLPQKNKYLFLPRNTKDNYAPNDRTIPFTDEISKIIVEKGGSVLNTYELNNLTFQYNIINNSDTIVVDYGGSFMFNCAFLENKKIILLHHNGLGFLLSFNGSNIFYKYISEKNNIILVDYEKTNIEYIESLL